MANYEQWEASMTLRDGADRPSTVSIFVPKATAQAYFAAADKAARDATAIGGWFAKVLTVSAMVEESRRVTVIDLNAPYTIPDEAVLRGNKIVLLGQTGPKPYKLTIPGRDATSYTPKTDSIEIDVDAAGDLKTFIESTETVALGSGGVAVDVQKALVND
jgi:hypothetical protein